MVILLNSELLRAPAPLPFCHPQDHEPNCATVRCSRRFVVLSGHFP